MTLACYRIVRVYQRGGRRTIKTGLTLSEAQEYCSNPETSSKTATEKEARRITKRNGAWMDTYDYMRGIKDK